MLLGFIGFPLLQAKLRQYAPHCLVSSFPDLLLAIVQANKVPGKTSKQSLWSITTQKCFNFAGSTPGRSSGISCRKPRELLCKDKGSAHPCAAHLPASQHWLLQVPPTDVETVRTLVDHAHQFTTDSRCRHMPCSFEQVTGCCALLGHPRLSKANLANFEPSSHTFKESKTQTKVIFRQSRELLTLRAKPGWELLRWLA